MKNTFRKTGVIVENRYRWVLLASVILIVVAIVGASNIKMESGTETMISTDSQVYKDYQRFNSNFGSDTVIVMVSGSDLSQLIQPENLRAYQSVEQAIGDTEQYPDIITVLGPALLIEQKMGTNPAGIEDTEAVRNVILNGDEIASSFANVLPDQQHALISIVLKPELESDRTKQIIAGIEKSVQEANFDDVEEIIITGTPVLMVEFEDLMASSLSVMFLGAIVMLLLVLGLIFKVRGIFAWRWLPLGVVLIGSIYTFGTMGFLGVGLSMVSMAVFPILIGLGIDYGIQVHNRYDEESVRGLSVAEAIIDSITHIGPAIGIALVAGCLGFAALFFSPVPMIRDFGLLLIIGVVAAYIVALLPLAGILYANDRRKHHNVKPAKKRPAPKQASPGIVEKTITRMAPWVIKNPMIIITVALLLTVGGLFADSHIETATDETTFINNDLEAMQNLYTLRDVAGGSSSLNLLLESKTGVATPEKLSWMDEFEDYLTNPESGYQDSTASIDSIARRVKEHNEGVMPQGQEEIDTILADLPDSMKKNLLSDDGKFANFAITLPQLQDDETENLIERLHQELQARPIPGDVQISITGSPVIGIEVMDAITGGRQQMTFLGLGLIFIGLVLLFRLRPIRALLATIPIVLIVGWSALVMYLLGIDFTPITATLGALIMGVGVEYTILVMSRYYEERENGMRPGAAMTTALTRIGRAVTVSAFTTIGGFAALLLATDFPILQDFGIVTLINVFFALVVSLVVLPPLIVMADKQAERIPLLRRL